MRRVVQWATGVVGQRAVAAIADHPDLELVGAFVYGDAKAGRDVGEIAGIGPLGVVATSDRDEIYAMDADCVLFMSMGEFNPTAAIDDICALLASGKNVVSTALTSLIYPRSLGEDVVARIEAACAEGGVSFHATGIEPGWASEVLPLLMSGLLRYVDTFLVQELLDYATYDSAEMLFGYMGFGRKPDEDVLGAKKDALIKVYSGPLMLLARGLGAEADIERFEFDREVWVTDEGFDIAAGRIEAGTVAAQRFSVSAVIDGRRALTTEHITRMAGRGGPDWPTGQGWRVTVEGIPSMVVDAHIATRGEDENDLACIATAMHAVHAIVPVCEADPGIRTFLDLPSITGRHILRKPEHLTAPTRGG